MSHKIFHLISRLYLFYFLSSTFITPVQADSLPMLDEILITSKHSMSLLSSSAGDIRILSQEDFSRLNAHTIMEVLETIPSINLIERGTPGSQADIRIRGSSIEGVLVLINGIRVHDPQTGHFTMDIPVDLSSVERIEVMSGGGSSLYGSSTSGGLINIVTKKESEGIVSGLSIGSYGSVNLGMSIGKQLSKSSYSLSLNGTRSDGYKKSSELERINADARGSFKSNIWTITGNIGLLNKKFGAGYFYAPYPSFEKTFTVQGGINATGILSDRKILRFGIGGRGHGDDFILIENNPGYYRNTHYNRSYIFTAEYLSDIYNDLYLIIGAETEHMGITSGSLGSHSDLNNAVYGELYKRVKKSDLTFSMRFDSGIRNENIFSPGFGMVIPLSNRIRFKINAEQSFRSPTYTELSYKSPANIGKTSLKTEHSSIFNTGFNVTGKNKEFEISLFARKSDNDIDWVRYTGDNTWYAANHNRLIMNGVEIKSQFNIFKKWESGFNAVVLNQSVKGRKGIESKYSLNPLGKTFTSILTGRLFSSLACTFIARYEEPMTGGYRIPVTMRLSRNFGNVKSIFSVRNMFNEHYEEIPGLPAPGRWFNLRMGYAR
ncbi:MAG TPA: TonB-dependent receptor [bacterium]|nr:TonB-dependent receptor [bacterium]